MELSMEKNMVLSHTHTDTYTHTHTHTQIQHVGYIWESIFFFARRWTASKKFNTLYFLQMNIFMILLK